MFSLLRKKDNLSQSSKVSTSCPSINSPGGSVQGNEEQPSPSNMSQDSTASSESDEEGIPKVSRSQRMFARKSVRRQRKKEKEFEKKIKHNKITMDDYLSKQAEFKLWLSEEKNKTVNDMKSPKTKAYFKAFVKLWNKKKLNQKFYRGTVSCETPPNPTGRQRCSFLSLADSPFPNSVSFPQTIDLSHDGSILSDSPFSTFGKSPGNPCCSKTPGSAHDLLDLKRKAIFNNISKENSESDRQSDHNSDDPFLPDTTRKSGSCSQSSSESTSGSISDSPRSSKSSASKKEKEENLYKVTVLSWTSKGELKVRPQNSPDVPNIQQSTEIDPDVLSKHLISQDYTSIDQHNTSIPYKEVNDAISDFNDPTYCVVGFPAPGYAQPYGCQSKQDSSLNTDKPGNASSIEDLYAVPIKKKKSSDQSETISLTSNESATRLDHKVNQAEMEKLSDIISSGSDFSITSGSSNESLHQNYLSVPEQDGLGKASSAPELSTILEGEVIETVQKSSDETANLTNVTAINMTLNTSYLDGNAAKQTNDKNVLATFHQVHNIDWKVKRFPEIGSLTSSTPDRKRNLSDPSEQMPVRSELAGQRNELHTAQRTLSDPTTTSPRKDFINRVLTPRSSLPSPPPPPNKDYPLCSPPPLDTPDIKSPNSESWPTPPPFLEHIADSEPKQTLESWPTPPTPYDLCDTDKHDINSNQPSPPIPPDPIVQTPDSVFSDTQKWPTPPTPQECPPENLQSEEEPPKLITADFISETQPGNIKPPILKISEIANGDVIGLQPTQSSQPMVEKVPFQEKMYQNNALAESKVGGSKLKNSERQVSTTSIERFETDIDAVVDSSTCDKENTQTKTRLVLETVV
ncbi:hypothetical protein LOTGIDRAFT_229621 [Lottia gigantea]|uniref:Uncharacterized protein n=1 Tax=Lottia gigantea TaxID=225164 RepID=V3ZIR8_LOTGI|nr:hypothetical protein LOTGIDRAFT_229621 [Lottia gigantea]ESO84127.1 hypothetical protein LOTGIDRAFT_229621 [Lottia gigantea]